MSTFDPFLGELSDDSLARAIVCSWERTPETTRELGASWYPAHAELLRGYWPDHPQRALGIAAALSPRAKWAVNLAWSRRVIDAYLAGDAEPPRVSTEKNRAKAWRIAQGEYPLAVLRGPKVRSFYRNLRGSQVAVTVDVWAARAAGLDMPDGKSLTDKQYAELQRAYRRAARAVGTDPRHLQASTWINERGSAE